MMAFIFAYPLRFVKFIQGPQRLEGALQTRDAGGARAVRSAGFSPFLTFVNTGVQRPKGLSLLPSVIYSFVARVAWSKSDRKGEFGRD